MKSYHPREEEEIYEQVFQSRKYLRTANVFAFINTTDIIRYAWFFTVA